MQKEKVTLGFEAETISGQSWVDVHLIDVGVVSNGSLLLLATPSIIRNTKTNKIIEGTNLRFLGIFFLLYVYNK
jgi:hypothetical protein